MIGSMSIGALSPPMWEGLAMGITYLNEVEGLPVVMCSGEGGYAAEAPEVEVPEIFHHSRSPPGISDGTRSSMRFPI